MLVFRQNASFSPKRVVFATMSSIWSNGFYSAKICYIWTKHGWLSPNALSFVVIARNRFYVAKWLYLGKMVAFAKDRIGYIWEILIVFG